ncbi:MAG: T9SS type A sorting domain-containing protein [Chitinophagales bacterium]
MNKILNNLKLSFISSTTCIFCLQIFVSQAQTTPDPGIPGAFSVSKLDYDLGDLAYNLPSFPNDAEVRGNVHYPTDLSSGPFPVLVFLHGRHATCYNGGSTQYNWPCAGSYDPITSFEGYDYLGQLLASHGYIVVSISANAINADDAYEDDSGMNARGELIQHHLDLWNDWNTIGGEPFDALFIGKLNLNTVGTLGHSRGGEGVVFNSLLNEELGSPYGIKAVLALAPVNFHRRIIPDIPFMNIAPYCDGDVYDLQGVNYYDDSRYEEPAHHSPKYSILMLGANHNFYNTVWTPGEYPAGTADDWDDYWSESAQHCGSESASSKRLTEEEQRSALAAYACAFFRTYVGGETQFLPLLNTEDIIPPVSSMLEPEEIFVSYHPSDTLRMDINRITSEGNENINTLEDTVHENSLTNYEICGGGVGMDDCDITSSQGKAPHESFSSSEVGLAQQKLQWNDASDFYENEIPISNRDLRGYQYLQFRVAVNYDDSPVGETLDFDIQLIDADGNISSQSLTEHTNALYYPPGNTFFALPKIMFNTVNIPLTAFEGIKLKEINRIRFMFEGSENGAILISDLALGGEKNKNVYEPELEGEIISEVPMLSESNFSIFPNPANEKLIITNQGSYKEAFLTISDLSGRIVYNAANAIDSQLFIDIKMLSDGMYFLQIMKTNETEIFTFVKQ